MPGWCVLAVAVDIMFSSYSNSICKFYSSVIMSASWLNKSSFIIKTFIIILYFKSNQIHRAGFAFCNFVIINKLTRQNYRKNNKKDSLIRLAVFKFVRIQENSKFTSSLFIISDFTKVWWVKYNQNYHKNHNYKKHNH